MKIKIFLFLFLISCNSAHVKKDTELVIKMSYGQSYTIDLAEKVYTIFFLTRPPLHIKFNLTSEEAKKIKDVYYSLNMDEFKNLELDDTCMIHPMIYTYIKVTSKSINQQIKIDESCKGYKDASSAESVNRFIQFIRNIVESKTEIKNAPSSDIEYM